MQAYFDIVRNVLDTGTRKPNRTGVDTLSTFHHSYELCFGSTRYHWAYSLGDHLTDHHSLGDGFPLLTTKSVSWKNIVVELLWFLSGRTDVEFLHRHGCKFWDAWVDRETGEVPSAYGHFWRDFPVPLEDRLGHGNDQIRWLVDELRKNPMSRRLVVSAWAPDHAQFSKLPPCHLLFVFNVQLDHDGDQRLCLHMTQRSCDVALGVPYNIASYALLLHLFSRFSGIAPGIFAHTLIDSHVYTCKEDGSMAEFDHVPGLLEQLKREPHPLPQLVLSDAIQNLEDVERLMAPNVSTDELMSHFVLRGYEPHPAISFKVAV